MADRGTVEEDGPVTWETLVFPGIPGTAETRRPDSDASFVGGMHERPIQKKHPHQGKARQGKTGAVGMQ